MSDLPPEIPNVTIRNFCIAVMSAPSLASGGAWAGLGVPYREPSCREAPLTYCVSQSTAALEEDLLNVSNMLAEASHADALVAALPILLEPKVLVSVLVTCMRWFPKNDPIQVSGYPFLLQIR